MRTKMSNLHIVLVLMLAAVMCCGCTAKKDDSVNNEPAKGEAENVVDATKNTQYAGDVLLVNRVSQLDRSYEPSDIVNLYEQERHFQLASSDIYLERSAFVAANAMFLQAETENVNGFIITSGYRTWDRQQEIFDENTDGTAAAPGQSEHQTGLAFDVTARRDSGGFETTDQFNWLIEHCWDYGFILRYPEDKEDVTGFSYEPWHYRYVGIDIAKIIHDNGWTLEEYCSNAQ